MEQMESQNPVPQAAPVTPETSQPPAAQDDCACSPQTTATAEPQLSPAQSGAGPGNSVPTVQTPSYVYAIGTIEARSPSLAVEKEFLQAVREGDTANFTDRQVFHSILSAEENRYLARLTCYVLTVEGLDTYILQPNSQEVLSQLIAATRPTKSIDRDVVIGIKGPIAPPQLCNGLQVPVVYCDRIYSFQMDEFLDAIPQPQNLETAAFRATAQELLVRVMQVGDNAGQDDEHRALNYLALRYPAIYSQTVEMHAADKSLSAVDVRPSRLSGSRKVVDVIFSYTDRNTDVVEKFFTRVDVTEQWPFLVTKLQPFFDRSR